MAACFRKLFLAMIVKYRSSKLGLKRITLHLLLTAGVFIFLAESRCLAQERLCDPAFEDCRTPLWQLIDAETQGIDVAFWFMQDSSYATKLINKFKAGVPVRVLVDPRANPTYAGNEAVLNQLRDAGKGAGKRPLQAAAFSFSTPATIRTCSEPRAGTAAATPG